MFLEILDLLKTVVPENFSDVFNRFDPRNVLAKNELRVYTGDQYILVMGTIKYPKFPPGRKPEASI